MHIVANYKSIPTSFALFRLLQLSLILRAFFTHESATLHGTRVQKLAHVLSHLLGGTLLHLFLFLLDHCLSDSDKCGGLFLLVYHFSRRLIDVKSDLGS